MSENPQISKSQQDAAKELLEKSLPKIQKWTLTNLDTNEVIIYPEGSKPTKRLDYGSKYSIMCLATDTKGLKDLTVYADETFGSATSTFLSPETIFGVTDQNKTPKTQLLYVKVFKAPSSSSHTEIIFYATVKNITGLAKTGKIVLPVWEHIG